MVKIEQVEALLDFLECHQELAHGNVHKSKEGRNHSRRLWASCADTLNSIGPDCPYKSGEGWRMYYNEMKYKTLKKIKINRAQHNANGSVAKTYKLTPTQERLCTILGQDSGDPLACVRHNPLSIPKKAQDSPHSASQGTTHQQQFQQRLKSFRRDRERDQDQTSRTALEETRAMVLRIEEKQAHTESLLAEAALRNADAAKLHAEAAKLQADASIMTAEAYKLNTQTMATFTENLSLIMPAVLFYIETHEIGSRK